MTTEDLWFTSLSVRDKELVASKILDAPVVYPEATGVWLNCSPQKKKQIFSICINRDISTISEWGNEQQFSE